MSSIIEKHFPDIASICEAYESQERCDFEIMYSDYRQQNTAIYAVLTTPPEMTSDPVKFAEHQKDIAFMAGLPQIVMWNLKPEETHNEEIERICERYSYPFEGRDMSMSSICVLLKTVLRSSFRLINADTFSIFEPVTSTFPEMNDVIASQADKIKDTFIGKTILSAYANNDKVGGTDTFLIDLMLCFSLLHMSVPTREHSPFGSEIAYMGNFTNSQSGKFGGCCSDLPATTGYEEVEDAFINADYNREGNRIFKNAMVYILRNILYAFLKKPTEDDLVALKYSCAKNRKMFNDLAGGWFDHKKSHSARRFGLCGVPEFRGITLFEVQTKTHVVEVYSPHSENGNLLFTLKVPKHNRHRTRSETTKEAIKKGIEWASNPENMRKAVEQHHHENREKKDVVTA